MSQIFDRFGRILRSVLSAPPLRDEEELHDKDMRDAMNELNSYLNNDTAVHQAGPGRRHVPEVLRSSYELLQVPFGSPFSTVQSAYADLLHKSHPDRNSSPDAAERTRRLIEAYRRIRKWENQTPYI